MHTGYIMYVDDIILLITYGWLTEDVPY